MKLTVVSLILLWASVAQTASAEYQLSSINAYNGSIEVNLKSGDTTLTYVGKAAPMWVAIKKSFVTDQKGNVVVKNLDILKIAQDSSTAPRPEQKVVVARHKAVLAYFLENASRGKIIFTIDEGKSVEGDRHLPGNSKMTYAELRKAVTWLIESETNWKQFLLDSKSMKGNYYLREAKDLEEFPLIVRGRARYAEVIDRTSAQDEFVDSRIVFHGDVLFFPLVD